MLRVLALSAALLPALASAQVTITETSDSENGNDQTINIEECSGAVASRFGIRWQVPATAGTVTQVDLRISDTSGCPLASTSNTAKTTSITNQTGTSGSLATAQTAQNLVSLVGYGCTANQSRPLYVCAIGQLGSTDVANATQSATIQLDTVTPSKPLNVKVTPGDSALDVSWDAVSGARRYKVIATPPDGSGLATKDSGQVSDTTSHRLSGLQNDVEYRVTVTSYTQGGNPSTPSVEVPGTPVQVNDFWRLYRGEGGTEQGGCGTPGSGAFALLALAALALRRRRRALPLLVLGALAAAAPARAAESPRWGTFSFQIVPYRPNVDAELRGSGFAPYQEAFGGGKHLMFRGEVAYSILKDYGSLDVGIGAGFWQAYGHGRVANTGGASSDPTRFRIIPTSLSLTYRLDQLANRGWLPLAPYGRIALERYNWWVTSGTGGVAYALDPSGNRRGAGATNGYSLTGGVAFLLDFIDRGLARDMDNDTGVNHTYLFGEVTKTKIDDFGSSKSWDLSTDGPVVVSGGLLLVF